MNTLNATESDALKRSILRYVNFHIRKKSPSQVMPQHPSLCAALSLLPSLSQMLSDITKALAPVGMTLSQHIINGGAGSPVDVEVRKLGTQSQSNTGGGRAPGCGEG